MNSLFVMDYYAQTLLCYQDMLSEIIMTMCFLLTPLAGRLLFLQVILGTATTRCTDWQPLICSHLDILFDTWNNFSSQRWIRLEAYFIETAKFIFKKLSYFIWDRQVGKAGGHFTLHSKYSCSVIMVYHGVSLSMMWVSPIDFEGWVYKLIALIWLSACVSVLRVAREQVSW